MTGSQKNRDQSYERLLLTLSMGISTSKDIDTALLLVLQKICETTDVQLGDAWMFNPRNGKMEFRILYFHDRTDELEDFESSARQLQLGKGEGLPGKVLERKNSVWIEHVNEENFFIRKEEAQKAGIISALGVPIPLDGEVIACLCFYFTDKKSEDPELVEVITAICGQIGMLVQQKLIEESLSESELRFRSVIESSPNAIVISDENGKIIFFNKGGENVFGYSNEELLNKPLTILMPERYRHAHENGMERYKRTGQTKVIGNVIQVAGLKKNGEEFPIELSLGTWTVKGQKFFSGIITDITDRVNQELKREKLSGDLREANKKLEETNLNLEEKALKRAKELSLSVKRFYSLADEMNELVWTASADGKIDYLNRKWVEYTGENYNDLLEDWTMVFHPDDREAAFKAFQQGIKDQEPVSVEFRIRRKDGNYRWHLCRASKKTDEDGQVILWIGINTDIEEQKRQNELKDEFISIASHELKTPLTTMKAYMQLLRRALDGSECNNDAWGFLDKTEDSIAKLTTLVSDLLDITKIQAGKLSLTLEPVDFDELVKNTVEGIQATLTQHKIRLRGSTGRTIHGDKSRLEQVLTNLLMNAVKYSPDADAVDVDLSVQDDMVQVAVRDYGIGIPESGLKKIFQRFYRADNAGSKIPGLGLGLYLSSEIVARHRGKIWVESEEGKGSVFTFRIPV